MPKQIAQKITIAVTITMLLSVQIFLPLTTEAATSASGATFSPSGNPYAMTQSNILDTGIIMSVVGCTGIVNRIAKSMTSLFASDNPTGVTQSAEDKLSGVTGDNVPVIDQKTLDAQRKIKQKQAEDSQRESCLNGVAIALAKRQLAAMTTATMNWVSSGFGGDPMFVRESRSYMSSITRDILAGEAKMFSDAQNKKVYPYGQQFARDQVNTYQAQNNYSTSMQSTLGNSLSNGATPATFSRNFSQGGWAGWLSLTQQPQNNPLGFTMVASQHTADAQNQAVQDTRDELTQNGGYLSQKVCKEWGVTQSSAKKKIAAAQTQDKNKDCTKWETVTPGSTIRDKINASINTPERQLELADTINKSLANIFSNLLAKFQNQGLSSLSTSERNTFKDISGGLGSNKVFDAFGTEIQNSGADGTVLEVNKGSGWSEGDTPFDLTKDLGNTYGAAKLLGTWDASMNVPVITPGEGTKNTYYTVSVTGNTDIGAINNRPAAPYSDAVTRQTVLTDLWKKNDKIFFDGTNWQKDVPANPIVKKGIIQVQKDYIDAVKKSMAILPRIMPVIGKLDYCIPGPNPGWAYSTRLALDATADYLQAIYIDKNGKPVMPSQDVYAKTFEGAKPWEQLNGSRIGVNISTGLSAGQQISDAFGSFLRSVTLGVGGFLQSIFGYESNADEQARHNRDLMTFSQDRLASEVSFNIDKNEGVYAEYKDKIDALYGPNSPMQTEFLTDTNGDTTDNPAYLPVAKTGLAITKNIKVYDMNIASATQDYKDLLDQSAINIYKLNIIKTKVDAIIKRAQAARTAARRKSGFGPLPQQCLDLEIISYLDAGHIRTDLGNIDTSVGSSGLGAVVPSGGGLGPTTGTGNTGVTGTTGSTGANTSYQTTGGYNPQGGAMGSPQ